MIDLTEAHKHCANNRQELAESVPAGVLTASRFTPRLRN